MLNPKPTMENLKVQHAYLEAAIHEEEQHVWKNRRAEKTKAPKERYFTAYGSAK